MNVPKRIELTQKEVDALLKRVKEGCLVEGDYDIIKAMAETLQFLSQAVEEKTHSIGRLLRQIFGATTEKLKNILPPDQDANTGPDSDRDDPSDEEQKKTRKVKGHGRNGASAYTPAETIDVPHGTLKPGDRCPECKRGRVYASMPPEVLIRIVGNAPLEARCYRLERLRCNLCGQVFTADTPEGVGQRKYDERAATIITMLKYGFGVPFYRMKVFHENLGIPLPPSTQWKIVEEMGETLRPVYEELIRLAARGKVIQNDDTGMKILAFMLPEQPADPNEQKTQRRAVYTSALLSHVDGKIVALFFTGRSHAGEAMNELLKQRPEHLPPPIQMCDAASRNIPKEFKTILGNCLVHARRQFVDVVTSFPHECRYVIEILAEVYRNDEETKTQNMSPSRRLSYHKQYSKPLMQKLHTWLNEQLNERYVEPNSGLGKAIRYMLRHWKPLTLFLRKPMAPLDNNIVERAIKFTILNRKNSLFYKTQHGADVGDCIMSVLHTCRLAGINIFEYLTQLQKHSDEVKCCPAKWLPWNYIATLTSISDGN